MKQNTRLLIDELKNILLSSRQKVLAFAKYDVEVLNHKEDGGRWSVLECIEHLNLYGDFYLPEIEKSILNARTASGSSFTTGVLGGYFAKLMKVGADGKMTKMKSPGDKDPSKSELGAVVLDRFIKQTDMLLGLLDRAGRVDLQRAKTPITLSRWIRLRLGDTFRFNIFHIERHVLQAERALRAGEKKVAA